MDSSPPQKSHNLISLNLSSWSQKKIFWSMLVSIQLTVGSLLWKSMATISCLVTNILHNIFFSVQQKKETHRGLEQVEGEYDDRIFIFGWTSISFRCIMMLFFTHTLNKKEKQSD